jgi:DNA processing protein
VENSGDILKGLDMTVAAGVEQMAAAPAPKLSPDEETVFRCITNEPKHIDRIMAESSFAPGKISGILINLELKGAARQLPGKYFVRDEV